MFTWIRTRRRRKLLAEPFPQRFEVILDRNVGHYPRLPELDREKIRDITRVLVAEKTWEGCNGLYVTEEMKVTIAAQAALLILATEHDYYARVESIVVYPGSFQTPVREDGWEDDGLSDNILAGQAVYRGPVILSWEEVLREGREPEAGFNVVVHEFAHQLDFLDNLINGTPPLGDRKLEERWRTVMTAAFEVHKKALEHGGETLFTEHAGDDETEFFADVSEAFYCRPHDLKRFHPDIYELMEAYYRVHPVEWF